MLGRWARGAAPSSCGRRARAGASAKARNDVGGQHPRSPHRGHPLRPAWAMVSAGALARCGPIADVDASCSRRQRADRTPATRDCAQLLERQRAQGGRADAERAGKTSTISCGGGRHERERTGVLPDPSRAGLHGAGVSAARERATARRERRARAQLRSRNRGRRMAPGRLSRAQPARWYRRSCRTPRPTRWRCCCSSWPASAT